MTMGYSTEDSWISLSELKDIEGNASEKDLFNDPRFEGDDFEAIWAVLDPKRAPRYLIFTTGSRTEEYLYPIDVSGATPVLQHEDGRVLYIRKKGGINHVERTNQGTIGQNTQAL